MGTRVLAFRLWETVPTWSHPLLPPFPRRIDCLVRLLEWEWLDILVKKKKKKGHETYVSKIFFLSLFISFFFFRSPVVLGQECKVRYRSVAFKQVFEGLEGLSLSMRETNSRRTGENVRNPHSFGGIARFVIFFPNNLISRRGRILGKCSLSLSLSPRVSKCGEFWSLPRRNRTKETGSLICTPVSSTFVESFGQALSRVTRI